MAWQYAQTTLQVKWSSICNSVAYWRNTTFKLFSSISFMYPTILNIVKHGKRVKHKKTTYLGKFKWGRNNKQQVQKIPMCIILVMVLFCPKHNFRVVKHAKWVHHVKLGIFLPHLHIKFIKNRATVIKLWIKAFYMAIWQSICKHHFWTF